MNRSHKRGKWLDQAEALQTGQPLRAVAGALHIHLSTAHRWRHRFLAQPRALQSPALTGIVEANETVFLLSFKGNRSGLERPARKRGDKAAKGRSQASIVHNCGRADDPDVVERLRRLAKSILRRCSPEEIVGAGGD